MDFKTQLENHRSRVDEGLDRLLPAATERPARIHEAMRYSLEAGGKRLRPVLVLAAADAVGSGKGDALAAAVAVECIHTYSLIHDDLPCMDNDDLRRGRPTCHRQFDEATALLAGDALLTYAFRLIGGHYPAETAAALLKELAEAAGSTRLIGGQMEDLLAEKKSGVSAGDLDFIHRNKTAAMIEVSLVSGGIVAGAPESHLEAFRAVGGHLGMAFQIVDDILDATADTATLGKTAGKDARADKTTYIKLHGLDASRAHARRQTEAALDALQTIPGDHAFLSQLIDELTGRTH